MKKLFTVLCALAMALLTILTAASAGTDLEGAEV